MKRRPRIVALDVGTKRVGMAMSDPLGLFAQPLGAYSQAACLAELIRIWNSDGILRLIIGWPLTLDGAEGEAVDFVRTFVDEVERLLPGVPWIAWDERFTTRRAREAILQAGARRKARRDKARVDAASAAIILQEHLDEMER